MGKNKNNGKQKQRLEEVPEVDEDEEEYESESDDYPGLADMLGEDNWANAALAGQHDPWGVHKTVQQNAGGSQWGIPNNQWGGTIPTPAQLAAHQAAMAAAASGSKGGGGGRKKGNNQQQKGDKKGGGKGAAHAPQAWESWGMDTRPQAAAEAWGTGGSGGWGNADAWGQRNADAWGPTPEEKRWEAAQPAKPKQGHWTGWSEEAKRLPKGHDVRAAYEQQQKGGQWDAWGGQQKGGGQWDDRGPQKGGQPKGGGQWDDWPPQKGGQQKGGGQWDDWPPQKGGQQKGGGQWDDWAPQRGGEWDDWGAAQNGGWDEQNGGWDAWGGQHEQQKGGQQKSGKKNKQNKQDYQQGNKQENKKNKKNQQQQQQQQQKQQKQKKQQQQDPWGTGGWDDGGGWGMPEEEQEYSEYDEMDRRVHFTPITSNVWGGSEHESTYKMPSKTLSHAYKGTNTALFTGAPRNKVSEDANVQFIDSKGAALQPVHQALFGKTRKAKDRIHWMFPPNKDERVASLLAWIETMSYNLGAYGLHRFLQSRERGALFANAEYRPPNSPNEPAFDWLTFDQLQLTRDKILQESVAFYDPSVTTVVFVFLPSKSGNSVAMWRRRITVGNNTRASRINEINLAMMGLRREKDYAVHVDEIPGAKKPENEKKKGVAIAADTKKRQHSNATTVTIILTSLTIKSPRNDGGGSFCVELH